VEVHGRARYDGTSAIFINERRAVAAPPAEFFDFSASLAGAKDDVNSLGCRKRHGWDGVRVGVCLRVEKGPVQVGED
jgi:N6-adenosine-specific RNA methylase IME4